MPYLHTHLKSLIKSLIKKGFDFEPITLGDHIRRRRLVLGIGLKEAGRRIGVTEFTVINWESRNKKPLTRHMPAIIRFIGYDPFPQAKAIPERLRMERQKRGWTQQQLASHLGVWQRTIADWERNGTILKVAHREKVAKFLGLSEKYIRSIIRKRWNGSHRQMLH